MLNPAGQSDLRVLRLTSDDSNISPVVKKSPDVVFGERVRLERKQRGWPQSQLSEMLRAKGVEHMHTVTISKIEAGDRPARLTEALRLAECFGVSVDALAGRTTDPRDDRMYALRVLADTADRSRRQVLDITIALHERLSDVLVTGFDFEGREQLQADYQRAVDTLRSGALALTTLTHYASEEPQ